MSATFAERSSLEPPLLECSRVRSKSVEKLSPSQKRRRRLQREAVRKSMLATNCMEMPCDETAKMSPCDTSLPSVNYAVEQRLAGMEAMLQQILDYMRMSSPSFVGGEPGLQDKIEENVSSLFNFMKADAWKILPSYEPSVLQAAACKCFNPYAKEFVPAPADHKLPAPCAVSSNVLRGHCTMPVAKDEEETEDNVPTHEQQWLLNPWSHKTMTEKKREKLRDEAEYSGRLKGRSKRRKPSTYPPRSILYLTGPPMRIKCLLQPPLEITRTRASM